jgi:hypothetical protein
MKKNKNVDAHLSLKKLIGTSFHKIDINNYR